MKCGFCAYDRAINFKKITTIIIYCALIMNSSNTSRVFIKCYTDTSIYVDLARMTATIHVQSTFKNILSLDINVLKKIERNSNRWGILQNSYTQARKEGFF